MATVDQIRRLSVTGTSTGLDKMAADLNKVGAAQANVAQTSAQVETATKRTTGTVINAQAAFDRLSRSIDPVAKAQAALDRATRLGAQAMQQNVAAIEQHQRNIAILQQRLDMARKGSVDHAQAVGLQRHQITNLSFQLNDMATMLASGSSPFQIMATQGGQVFQILQQGPQGLGGSVRQLGSMLLGLVTPARLAMGAVGAIGLTGFAAWNSWDNKIKDVQRSLNQLGRGTGLTTQSLTGIADRAASGGSLNTTQALAGASGFAGASIFGDVIERLLPLSRQFAGATGLSITESQKELSAIGNPVQALGELSRRFGPFGFEVEQNVRRLQSLGRLQEAQMAVTEALTKRLSDATDTTGFFARSWEKVTSLGDRLWTALGRAGAAATPEQTISSLEDERRLLSEQRVLGQRFAPHRDPRLANPNAARIAEIDAELERQRAAVAERERKAAADAAEAQRIRDEAIARQNRSIAEDGQLGARGVLARSASERLAIEQERILKEARYDAAKAATAAADAEKARTMALAEANRALRDYARNSRDEAFMGGAMTDVERFRRQTQLEQRDLRERTDILRGASAPATEAAAQMASGFNAVFGAKIAELMTSFPDLRMTSGVRTEAEQRTLRAIYGTNGAAAPGNSRHEAGLAADFSGRNLPADQRAAVIAAAESMGLKVIASNHGAMHIEGPKEWAGRGATPVPLTVRPASDAPGPVDQPRTSAYITNLTNKLFHDTRVAAEAAQRQLDATADTFGKSTYEIARQNEAVRLENDLRRAGVTDMAAYADQVRQLAEAEGRLAQRREQVAEAQRRQIAAMDEVRSSTADLIGSPLKAIARGESGSEALRQVGLRMGDKMIDAGSRGISEVFFGKMGKPGGGLFGDLLGGLMGSGMTTASMTVQAGTVIVGSPMDLPGASGGGGILGSLFKGVFGGGGGVGDPTPAAMGVPTVFGGLYANGAAFRGGNVVAFANGGVVSGPTPFPMSGGRTGVMGEKDDEGIMPLKRDRAGRLGVIVADRMRDESRGARVASYRGGDIIIQGNVTEEVYPRVKRDIQQALKRHDQKMRRGLGNIQRVNEEDYI